MLRQHAMKAAIVDQISRSFTTTTCRVKKETLTTEGLMHGVSTEGKNVHLLAGSMSAQGNDDQLQHCGAGVQKEQGSVNNNNTGSLMI